MISNTVFVIQNNLFVKLKNCNLQALYKLDDVQIHNQTVLFILRKDALYQVVCIYFKSAMCFVTIPLVDTATLFCLEVTAAKEKKRTFHHFIIFKTIFDNCFKILTIGRGPVLSWPIAIIAFSRFLSQ